MSASETSKAKKVEEIFLAVVGLVLLAVLPIWGAIPMLVGSAVGLLAYAILFRKRLRSRGWHRFIIPVAIAVAAAAAMAFAMGR